MSGLDRIEERCRRTPSVRYGREGDMITVHSANDEGFPVSFIEGLDRSTVYFLG